MGVRIDGDELRRALAMRGLLQQDLARLAGVSETGVSLAIRGRPVRPSTFGRIARALAAAPVIELAGAERLLAAGPGGDSAAEAGRMKPTSGTARDRAAAPGTAPETALLGTRASGHPSK